MRVFTGKSYPVWLQVVARWVDERCFDRKTYRKFQAMVRKSAMLTDERLKELEDQARGRAVRTIRRAKRDGRLTQVPPFFDPKRSKGCHVSDQEWDAEENHRGLQLCEKYAELAWIHDRLCITSAAINPFDSKGGRQIQGQVLAVGYEARCQSIDTYDDDEFPRVTQCIRDVAKDLGVDALEIPSPLSKAPAPVIHVTDFHRPRLAIVASVGKAAAPKNGNQSFDAVEPARNSPDQHKPAWERLQIKESKSGDDIAVLDGKEYRIKSAAAVKLLIELQKKKGETLNASVLSNAIGNRPDRAFGSLPKRLQRIIDKPGRGGKGYRMK